MEHNATCEHCGEKTNVLEPFCTKCSKEIQTGLKTSEKEVVVNTGPNKNNSARHVRNQDSFTRKPLITENSLPILFFVFWLLLMLALSSQAQSPKSIDSRQPSNLWEAGVLH